MRSWSLTLGFVVSLTPLLTAQSVPFTDNPLVAQSTVVKAVHFTELRARINTQRVARNLDNFTFTD